MGGGNGCSGPSAKSRIAGRGGRTGGLSVRSTRSLLQDVSDAKPKDQAE
jgi:hypothetical protein